jgi:hypothetical protein
MVSLEGEQLKALKARARSEGISLAELMRRLVGASLNQSPSLAPVDPKAYEAIVALGSSGRADIGDRHDAHLADALRREHDR